MPVSESYFRVAILADEATASLGRNRALRRGACMHNRLLATLYAVVVQLVEPQPSKLVVASSSLVYRSMS